MAGQGPRAHVALLAVTLIWGLAYLATKVALRDMGPFALAFARMAIATAIIAPAFARTRTQLGLGEGLVLGALGVTVYYGAYNVGIVDARVTDAGVIQAAIPVASALVAIPLLGERGTLAMWLGVALSTLGVVVLVSGTSAAGEGSLGGDLWIVLTVIDWALYSAILRRISRRASDTAITAATIVWGTALLLPLAAVEIAGVPPRITADAVVAIVFLGVLSSALGYWLWAYGVARVETGRAASYLNLLPLVAAASGALVLGERLGALEVIGAALILGGVALTQRR